MLCVSYIISGCSAVGSAGGLGPSGRGFEPLHSDQISNASTGGVAYFFARLGSNPRALRNVPVEKRHAAAGGR